MQTVRLRSLSSLRIPLSATHQPNLPPRAHQLADLYPSAFHAQKRNLVHGSAYKRTHLHTKRFSTNDKPPNTVMSETVIREVAKDVWIFSK